MSCVFVYTHDGVYRDTTIIYRFYIFVKYVFTSSLLNRLPAQHHLSRVRPTLPRDFPYHLWKIVRRFLDSRAPKEIVVFVFFVGLLE